MCNVPCLFCCDYDECTIRHEKLIDFEIFNEKGKCGETSLTKIQAEEFTFLNPELILITKESDYSYLNSETLI